ncbi:GNAT family N-acetyltransferase [Aeromonas sp. 61P]|uniref:GNAT family N-acetyltransferase n=1 Tax=Aeromonas sp. 61P TaxID=3452721 RepID=UPI003F7AEE8A
MTPALNPALCILPLGEAHIPALVSLFEQAVRRSGPEHYSAEQVEQWALGSQHPGFVSQLREHHGWVAEQANVPLGFVTLSPDGHLSLLYVSADHQRQGLGNLLLTTALAGARGLGMTLITTEASTFSYELFLRHGFTLTGLECVERGGVSFTRHRLHCCLPS